MTRRLLVTTWLVVATVVGCGDDRPDIATWRGVWETRQALVPSAEAIVDGGQDFCGERLGVFRTDMPALLPTPADELDGAVEEWIAHAETIVFECPTDLTDLTSRFEALDVLAAEVDAGVAAETDG